MHDDIGDTWDKRHCSDSVKRDVIRAADGPLVLKRLRLTGNFVDTLAIYAWMRSHIRLDPPEKIHCVQIKLKQQNLWHWFEICMQASIQRIKSMRNANIRMHLATYACIISQLYSVFIAWVEILLPNGFTKMAERS